ncbi:MAG: VCBS repeat-containing protein [Planctomycetes bacterium]|nr:VCBS repeat-containing protein [Planctomycetota bacterium]
MNFAEDRREFVVKVDLGPPHILPQTPPTAQYRASYSYQIDVAGGTPPYTFIKTGGTLPPGLSVGSTGIIGNFPTKAEQHPYQVTVQVTDANLLTDVATLDVDVVVKPLIFQTVAMPDAADGYVYDAAIDLASDGGGAPFTWTVLPPGPGETALGFMNLGLTSAGHVTSLSPAGAMNPGTYLFTVQVQDEAGQLASRQMSLRVASSPVITSITPRTAASPGPFTVTGVKFQPGAQLVFNPGGTSSTITPTWVNATTMTFNVAPALGVAGPVTVRVLNPDAGKGDTPAAMLYPASAISFGTKGFIASAVSTFGLDAGDVNKDGLADLVHCGTSGFVPFAGYAQTSAAAGLHLLRNNGSLSFSQVTLSSSSYTDCKFVDLDVDGDLDVLAISTGGLASFLNNGSGTFTAGPVTAVTTPPASTGTSYTSAMAIGKLNGDSIPDVVWGSGNYYFNGSVYSAIGLGTGGFTTVSSAQGTILGSFYGVNAVELVDMNNDSIMDTVATPSYYSSTTPQMRISTMSSGGVFGSWSSAGNSTNSWSGINAIRKGNFLGQTGPCVVVAVVRDQPDAGGAGGDMVTIYYGSGFGSSMVLSSIPGSLKKGIGTGDLDFDGISDIVVTARVAAAGTVNPPTGGTPGTVYVVKGSNGQLVQTLNIMNGTPTITAGQAGKVATGDLDGDGRPDLIVSTSFWATDNQRSTTFQRGESSDGNPLGLVYYLNTSN